MRVEPSPVHLWDGNWTIVRTHTSIQLSKAASAFASHPLGLLQVSRERVTDLAVDALIDPNVFDDFDTGLRI
jgi:hypothetical protein